MLLVRFNSVIPLLKLHPFELWAIRYISGFLGNRGVLALQMLLLIIGVYSFISQPLPALPFVVCSFPVDSIQLSSLLRF